VSELDDDDDDRQQHRIADDLQQAHPSWMVLFGSYSRMFWAFPLFGPGSGFFDAADPRELERRMNAAEMQHRNRRRP
jgi:hypothetical protein